MANIKELLLQSPSNQLDESMFPLIEKWEDNHPTSLQVLEVLDKVIAYSLGSSFVVSLLQILLNVRMKEENTTLDKIVEQAVWRV
jgi:hypothetical protein